MSVTWDELVEIATRARWGLADDGSDIFDGLSLYAQQTSLAETRAALSAIREAGVRFMPAEATEEMLDVMHDRVRILVVPSERRADIQNDVEVYTAMLAGGEIKPEDGK